MPSICVVTPPDSGCAYYRAVLPVRHCGPTLKAEGVDLVLSGERLDMTHDAYVFQRSINPEILPAVLQLHMTGKAVYWDIDDEFFRIPAWSSAKPLVTDLHLMILRQCLELARGVSVSTQPLLESLGLGAKGRVLPNLIDTADWPEPSRPDRDHCVLLWAGSKTHEEDLRVVLPALRHAKAEFGGKLRVVIVGGCPAWLASDAVVRPTVLYGCPVESYPGMLAALSPDIGIAPLADDGASRPFNRCKSAVKWMEYSMAGAVTVASNVTPYRDAVWQDSTGYLANQDGSLGPPNEFWAAELIGAVREIRDGGPVRGVADEARADVVGYHSWQSPARTLWLDWFRSVASATANQP